MPEHTDPLDLKIAMQEQFDRASWEMYDAAADWCARYGLARLPIRACFPGVMPPEVLALIQDDPDAFEERVRAHAYANAMASLPEDVEDP